MQKKFILEKIPAKNKKISKCIKKISFFKKTIKEEEINPKNKWFKKFEKYWKPREENALKELKILSMVGMKIILKEEIFQI